ARQAERAEAARRRRAQQWPFRRRDPGGVAARHRLLRHPGRPGSVPRRQPGAAGRRRVQVMTAIGFIGLGRMGAPMAARLAASGHALTVCDVDAAAAERFCAAHPAKLAPTPRAAAEGADVLITMLPNSAIVAEVLRGPDGVLAGL